MRRLGFILLAALFAVGVTAAPVAGHYDDEGYDRHGYHDDDCSYYDDCGYHGDGGHHGHGYYRGGPRCVFHQQVGSITVDFLCHY